MSRLILTGQASAVSTPGAGKIAVFAETTNNLLKTVADDGSLRYYNDMRRFYNSGTSQQTGFAADQYLAGSLIQMPKAGRIIIGTYYRCRFYMSKTAAGTAGAAVTLRVGVNGSTADGARPTLTFGAGTAAVDSGIFTVEAICRNTGTITGLFQAVMSCQHSLAATGLISTGASGWGMLTGSSGAFNIDAATCIGVSFNGGASFAGTCEMVEAELFYL